MKLRHIFTIALAAFSLAACENEPKEQPVDPVLEVEPAEINVAAAASSTPITITSNCPWTVQMVSGVDWIEVDTPSGGSKTAKAEDTVINVTVTANTGSTSRSCSLYVVSESSLDPIQITVTQAAVAPSLAVAPAAAIAEIPAAGGEVTFNVTSNTAWAVAVETGATADVTLSKASGNGNASVVATFAASNVTTKLSATIKFTAEKCDPVSFTIEQAAGAEVGTFSIVSPAKAGHVDPEVFNSFGSSPRWFGIESTVAWTARITDETTASGAKLVTTSGTGSLEKFEVSVGQNTDFANRKTVVIEFQPEGLAPVQKILQQEKASILTLEFRSQDNGSMIWPFTVEASTATGDKGPGSFTAAGYTFSYNTVADCMMEAAHGWRLGTGSGCWVQTPAIAGKKLVKVSLADGNSANTTPNIVTTDGAVVAGGQFTEAAGSFASKGLGTWTLAGTEANKSYRLISVADKTMRILYLSLEYADAAAADPDYLSVTSPLSVTGISGDGGTTTISVNSNTAWTARVKDGATASVSLGTASGSGSGSIVVTVAANPDNETKQAVIVLSAAGCSDVEVTISQEKKPSGLSVELSLPTKAGNCEPGVFPSVGSAADRTATDKNGATKNVIGSGKRVVVVATDKSWTARIGDGTTAANAALSKTSGTGNAQIEVTVGPNTDFANRKKVVVEVAAEGEGYASIEIAQEKAAIVTIECRNLTNKDAAWAFDDAPNANDTQNSGTGTLHVAGMTFGYNASTTCMVEPGTSYGWRVGRGIGNYIEFPAIAGKKLVKVFVVDGNAGGDCHIQTSAAEPADVEGGNLGSGKYKSDARSGVTFNLTGTAENTAYRLNAVADGTIRIKHLELTYE